MLSLIMLRMAAEANQREDIEENQPRDDGVLVLWEPPGEMEGDTILTVGSNKIAVNKIYLSQLSDYFRALFCGNFRERETNEFVIREVDEDEFIEMLLVLLPTRKPIDENNVESLLELADRFIIESLQRECHSFLGKKWEGYFGDNSSSRSDDAIVIWKAPCGKMESDTVIEVGMERKKFAVNKVYLAQYSKLFYDMFYGRENPKTWVEGVTADMLESLLRVILPTHEPITWNVEDVLKASSRLQIPSLYRHANFVGYNRRMECVAPLSRRYHVSKILEIAFCENLDELKEYCRSRLPSKVHVDNVRIRVVNRCDVRLRAWLDQLYATLPNCAVPEAELERSVRPKVFIDISQEGEAKGRIVMELFSDKEPKAAENFRSLCTGERGLDLQGRPLHLKGTTLSTGRGSVYGSCLNETIYGTDRLERESSEVVYDEDTQYLLMSNNLIYRYSLVSRIVVEAAYDYYNRFAFGRVVEGFEVMQSLSDGHTRYIVADCGEL